MPRPRTPVGQHGGITLTGHVTDESGRRIKAPAGTKPTAWRARTKYRDRDGKTRDVEAWAPTKGKAETALRARLGERVVPHQGEGLRRDMTVSAAAGEWLIAVTRQGRLSQNTLTQYREAIERHIEGSDIANLSVAEVNRVAVLERFLQDVADAKGLGSAKTARTVLGSILGLAVRHEALDGNRMRDAQPPRQGAARATAHDVQRAFTADELRDVCAKADKDAQAKANDIVDLIYLLAGTGARISEALALRWEHVDLDAAEVQIEGTKTKGSRRVVTVPTWLVERLRTRRAERGPFGLVFPTPEVRWGGRRTDPAQARDRRDVTRKLRATLDTTGYPWATAHTFRRTVADLVSEAAGPTEAANMLGHARPSMTLDHYTDRRQKTTAGAAVLDQIGG
jgi:integrase